MSRRRTVLCLTLLTLLPVALPTQAQMLPCEIAQVTDSDGDDSFDPSISRDGEAIAFVSNADFTGMNAGGVRQVFLWRSGAGFTQIGPIADVGFSDVEPNLGPRADADGSRVVFSSTRDPLGGNADGSLEIFLWDSVGGLVQLTDQPLNRHSRQPTISADGSRVAFQSNADLAGANPLNRRQVFLWIDGGGFQQITSTEASFFFRPAISDDGTRIAFEASDQGLFTADRTSRMVLWREGAGLTTISGGLGGENRFPSADAAGTAVSFSSTANPDGGNGDGSFEIVRWSEAEGVQRLTGGAGQSGDSSIDAAGRRIAFFTDELAGSEIRVWDALAGLVTLTSSPGGMSFEPTISGDGLSIAFTSTADLVGTNPGGAREVFLALCPALLPADVPGATPLASLLLALALAGTGATFLVFRRA